MGTGSQPDFFRGVLDAMAEQIAVIELDGAVRYVNRPWLEFCAANDGPDLGDWQGVNYLGICDDAGSRGDEFGSRAAEGIRQLASGRTPLYSLEYPCHSPDERRWFMAQMAPLRIDEHDYIVISHHNITQRKLAEQRAEELARTDPLVGIANRGRLDAALDREWKRALRGGHPLSALIVDIDAFKSFNDGHGHRAGDECLRRIGRTIDELHRRATDLVGRYGGEEFLVLLAESDRDQAVTAAERILAAVRELRIPHADAPAGGIVTVSIGVASFVPETGSSPASIVDAADGALYAAKEAGRDRYCVAGAGHRALAG